MIKGVPERRETVLKSLLLNPLNASVALTLKQVK